MELSEKLRVARQTAGLTQRQVFERCGIDDSALSEFENARREPRLAQLHKLAETYRIPLSWFFQESLPQSQLVMWRNADEGDRDTENRFLELCRQYHQLEMWTGEKCSHELPRLDEGLGPFWYPEVIELAEKVRRHMALGERPAESLHRLLEELSIYIGRLFRSNQYRFSSAIGSLIRFLLRRPHKQSLPEVRIRRALNQFKQLKKQL